MAEQNYSSLQMSYDDRHLDPIPMISISKTPTYNNNGDNVIGNSFQITFTGYASSVVQSLDRYNTGIHYSLHSLEWVKEVFYRNGKTLKILDKCTGEYILLGSGGKLISFDVQEGNWVNYVQYNATLEFSELSFSGLPNINQDSISSDDLHLVQLMYRLKSYSDKWNFTVSEEEAYKYYNRWIDFVDEYGNSTDAYAQLREDYSQITVSYNITANGKDHYTFNQNTAVSSWEMAKEFVQYKMWHQIYQFRNGALLSGSKILSNTEYNSLDKQTSRDHEHSLTGETFVIPVVSPILDSSIMDRYEIYNEYIDCATSQTQGTFTATYNCILRRSDYVTDNIQPNNSIHSFTVSYDQVREPRSQNRTITINGSLQGILRTNILLKDYNDGQGFYLPRNGVFYGTGYDTVSRYGNAYEDFVRFIADPDFGDLKKSFKTSLLINYDSLFPGESIDKNHKPCVLAKGYQHAYQILALPKEFSYNSNYKDGVVEYTAVYDTERSCAMERGFNSMTITEEDPTPMHVEHTVIGRKQGPIVQNLNTNTFKKLTIQFDGVTRKTCVVQNPWSRGRYEIEDPARYEVLKADVCDTEAYTWIPWTIQMIYWATEKAAWLLGTPLLVRDFSTTYRPSDGTYTVSKQYMVMPKYPTNKLCVENPQDDPNVGQPKDNN